MNSMMPAVFVSHGAPTLALDEGPVTRFLEELGRSVPQPRAVLCVSAHWNTRRPAVTATPRPETIHDFYGFPEGLYEISYPAPGDAALAASVLELLEAAGIPGAPNETRGLDHGAWVPLRRMFPEARTPIVQLAVQPAAGAAHHLSLGRALRPLRKEGVLILGSGGATHNLREFGGHAENDPPVAYAAAFDRWLASAVEDGRLEDLLAWDQRGPEARRNHPTPEHLLPIFVPLGAAEEGEAGRRLYEGFTYGILSMAAFAWGL